MTATLEAKIIPATSQTAGTPKYQVLADQLRLRISEGELLPGDRLPSFAEIGAAHRVTLTTVKRVYDLLEKEGLIERQQGRGTFVCEQKRILTGSIGIMGTRDVRLRQSQYYDQIWSGIESYASQHDQHLLFVGGSANYDHDFSQKVDGFLMCDVELQDDYLKHLMATFPCVSMFSKSENINNVMADDHEAAKTAVRYLMDLGHRRIACLMEKQLFISCQRLSGYRDGLAEAGIEASPSWARVTEIACLGTPALSYLEWGRSQMQQWLREGWLDLGCTAVLAQNDAGAIGVMQALQDEGINVPGQVSVMGFDGTDLCDHASPRMTSMKVPLSEIGYTAAQLLHESIQNPQQAAQGRTIMLPAALRPGKSVAKVHES